MPLHLKSSRIIILAKRNTAKNSTPAVAITKDPKRILVAPLNWGLGHATRCIPLIYELQKEGFTPVIASDGQALSLLRKEFPNLEAVELPSYNIHYSKKGVLLTWTLLRQAPKIWKTIKLEQRAVHDFVKTHKISGIISDNRFGIFYPNLPSVYITHQLKVLSGFTTWLSTRWHQKIIQSFDECWIPDAPGVENLSGALGHTDISEIKLEYIGPLSRFKKQQTALQYDIMVLLSGPEPQRQILENKLLQQLKNFEGTVLFVKGIVEPEQKISQDGPLTIYNFMTSELLENSLNASEVIIARSGYTTIMDLATLEKKVFFIPTPGQLEQNYLAKTLQNKGIAPFCHQDKFDMDQLRRLKNYTGLTTLPSQVDYKRLFRLFERE